MSMTHYSIHHFPSLCCSVRGARRHSNESKDSWGPHGVTSGPKGPQDGMRILPLEPSDLWCHETSRCAPTWAVNA